MFFKTKFRASRYNVVTPCPDGGHLLFNQISGMLVRLNEENLGLYNRAASGRRIPSAFANLLHDGSYLVPQGHDERADMRKVWDEGVDSPLAKALTIVTTDRCNLGCSYCYEEKSLWRNMEEETQKDIMAFTRRYLEATPTRSLGVTWFGGEATLNMKAMERLSQFFMEICEEKGIPYRPFLITNGTTLNDTVITKIVACGISALQVTVDGIKEDHDVRRPYLIDLRPEEMNAAQVEQRKKISLNVLGQETRRPRKSSFEDIMANVRAMHRRGLMVALRVNVDHGNKGGVQRFFEQLDADGLLEPSDTGGIIRVYTHAIFDGCAGCPTNGMTKAEHAKFDIDTSRWTRDRHPESFRKSMRFSGDTCTANKNFHFVINPDGGIVKCWHDATDPTKSIGNVKDLRLAEIGTAAIDRYPFNPFDDPECSECSVLPLCMGGCKANNKFQEDGYAGKHEMGCHATRFALAEEVVELYRHNV